MKKRADEKALDLRVIINPLLPKFLFGDQNRLQQAITNLMTNAIKYTDTGYVELKIDFEKEQDNKVNCISLFQIVGVESRKKMQKNCLMHSSAWMKSIIEILRVPVWVLPSQSVW